MPAYLYWGEDDYSMARAIQALHEKVLNPAWQSFNYDKIEGTGNEATAQIIQGFNQAMTPPFGLGERLVWLHNPTLGRQTADDVLTELERTLPVLPPTSHLLMTFTSKPDGRSKAIKLLQKHAQVQEFSPIPPWKTQLIENAVNKVAKDVGIQLAPDATTQLAEAIGNDTRRLYNELEKLKLYQGQTDAPAQTTAITGATVALLVPSTTQNSLQLAAAIRQGQTGAALSLVAELLTLNEPGLKIVATLIRQFRTWLWVKLMLEAGERDERVIAKAAEVRNPKRIYFLQQDVKALSSQPLRQVLRVLLELDISLKQGSEATSTLQTKVIEMCQYCKDARRRRP